MQRRHFLASTGALAVMSALSGCGSEVPDEDAAVPPPAEPIADAVTQDVASAVPADFDDELINDFLAESFSEPDSVPSAVSDTVISLRDLEDNPELFITGRQVLYDVRDGKIKAAEMADEDAVDFRHLAIDETFGETAAFSEAVFDLNSDLLLSIAGASHYEIDPETYPEVLFGLRGCELETGSTAEGETIKVREAKIDHIKRRCLIGVWNTVTGHMRVFEGSTVPNLVNMQLHLLWKYTQDPLNDATWPERRSALTNQLPQGLHSYHVGTHLRSSSNAARRHPGAFLQASPSPVLRAQNDLSYSTAENWDPLDWRPASISSDRGVRVTNNNIHAAVNKVFPGYASQGCQTIQGFYQPRGQKAVGAWSAFQKALGITITETDGKYASNLDDESTLYKYFLTSGREARLHTLATEENGYSTALKRLRIGSSGAVVQALRAKLTLSEGDQLDAEAMNEVLRWQSSRMPKDGVITPAMNADFELGLEL